jgi:hypothetical protein
VVAAVAHAEVASAAPFVSHNGLVARAVERLLLVGRGVDSKSLLVPEAGHSGCDGSTSRTCAATATGVPAGVQAWLLYAAEAYARSAEASPLNAGA